MMQQLTISFVIPAYAASETIETTLRSIFYPSALLSSKLDFEVIVVNDGSPDYQELTIIIDKYPKTRRLDHSINLGMCAARNTGIAKTVGDIVVILDADDALISNWPSVIGNVLAIWPEDINVCYSACQTPSGKSTVSDPTFTGLLTLDDLLNERHPGEYLPMFRGSYIRAKKYCDLGIRKSCGIVSYLTFAQDGDFWVTSQIIRIYYDQRKGSISYNWTSSNKAYETVKCYQVLFEKFGKLYQTRAPQLYRKKLLRYAVYLGLSGDSRKWKVWQQALSFGSTLQALGALLMILGGSTFTAHFVRLIKQLGWIKKYG